MCIVAVRKSAVIAIALLICLTVVFSFSVKQGGAAAVFKNNSVRLLPIYSVETAEKKIAISFDCAWGTDYTDKLIETMQSFGISATFFAVKFWTEKYPEYIKKLNDAGFEIGTHSATHPHMASLTKEEDKLELTSSILAIQKITGVKVRLFRPPFGEYDDKLITVAQDLGLKVIQWSVDSLDWKNISADEIYSRVTSKVKNGSIVLFHNQGLHTYEALPMIISTLLKQGYEFVKISELIYENNYRILPDGTQIKTD